MAGKEDEKALAFLDSLYQEELEEQDEPAVLSKSQIMKAGSQRVTYNEAALRNGLNVVSTLRSRNPGLVQLPDTSVHDRQLDTIMKDVQQREAVYLQQRLTTLHGRKTLADLQKELDALQAEEDQLLARQPLPLDRLNQVQGWIIEHRALIHQQRLANQAHDAALVQREAQLRAAETEWEFVGHMQADIDEVRAQERAIRSEVASTMHQLETKAATKYIKRMEKAQAELEDFQREQEAIRAAQVRAAKIGQKLAQQRVLRAQNEAEMDKLFGAVAVDAELTRRHLAHLELKASVAASRRKLAERSELLRQKEKQKKEQEEEEKEVLIEAGLNPYEVYRKRMYAGEEDRRRKEIEDKMAARSAVIEAELDREMALLREQLMEEEEEQRHRAKFQKEMGVATAQRKTEAYLRRVTDDHVPILNATGHLHILPSEVMTAKTWDFGQGTAEPKLTEAMAAKYPDVEPGGIMQDTRLRRTRVTDDDPDEDWANDAPPAEVSERQRPMSALDGSATPREIRLRSATKHEGEIMAAAKARHRDAIAQPKNVRGVTWAGDAFIASPTTIVFKDFEVGQTYTQKLTIINRGFVKNNFRLLDLPLDCCEVVSCDMTPPGHMGPGSSCEITVTFKPRVNEDLFSHIPCLAETGPFQVPVQCLIQRTKLSLSTHTIDYDTAGGVLLAESLTESFTIVNDGALEAHYVILVDETAATATLPPGLRSDLAAETLAVAGAAEEGVGADGSGADAAAGGGDLAPIRSLSTRRVDNAQSTSLETQGFSIAAARGTVPGYGRVVIPITFAPKVSGLVRLPLKILYIAPKVPTLLIEPHELLLSATGREMPVYTDTELLDFKCCMFDHVYKSSLMLHNSGKTTMKVSVLTREGLSDFVEFTPEFGYVQGGDSFKINVMFKPRLPLVDTAPGNPLLRFLSQEGPRHQRFTVPLRVQVPAQPIPVDFTITAQVTSSDLLLLPNALDFGDCPTNERTAVKVSITNQSALPQSFAFLDPPEGVAIRPCDGFGNVLPGDTMEVEVCFRPQIVGPQRFFITCSTIAGRSFTLPCRASGVAPLIELSHNEITMPATAVLDTTTTSTIIRNMSDESQDYEFALPKGSFISLCPRVGTLAPRQSVRLKVDYTADASLLEEHPLPSTSGQEEGAAPPEPWRVWRHWTVPCYIRASGSISTTPSQVLHMEVTTCAVQQELDVPDLPKAPNKPYWTCDFGNLPVGERLIRVFEVHNNGVDEAPMKALPLDPALATFSLISAVRPIEPSGNLRVVVAFMPQSKGHFYEMLTFKSAKTTVRVALKGVGVAPEVALTPETATTSGLDFGDVLQGETAEASFDIANVCSFPVDFKLVFLGQPEGVKGAFVLDPGRRDFFCKPSHGLIPVGATQKVTVVFSPGYQAPYFSDRLQVVIPFQPHDIIIPVKGRGWSEGVFISGPEYPKYVANPFQLTGGPLGPLHGAVDRSVAAPRTLTLTFPAPCKLGEVATHTLTVGCLKSALSGAGAPGEFVLDDVPPLAKEAGWAVEPVKLPLAPGDRKAVTFKYTAPKAATPTMAAYHGLREYVELTIGAMLKGGLPAPPSADGLRVMLRVRCAVDPPNMAESFRAPA